MLTPAAQFQDAIRAAGLTPPEAIEPDGELHRFPSNGDHGDDAGWYVLHGDGIPAGSFGDWRSGLSQTWRADIGRKLSPAEALAQSQRIADARKKREAAEAQRHAEARKRATERWAKAIPPDPDHQYLVSKAVQPHGIRQEGDLLLVPMRDGADLHSLQTIGADGDKRFLSGGRVAGCYFSIGKPGDVVCIAEGYATGATIHEATGYPVAVAFNACNLVEVARKLRARLPNARIVICADDDYRTDGNPGLTKATEAARAVAGLLAMPNFGDNRLEDATDFNDLAKHAGPAAVKHAIGSAREPDGQDDQAADPEPWPDALDEPAFHGIAGEFVRMVEPNTEADQAAILMQFLVAFGALVGRGPHYKVEGDEHHVNLFLTLIGKTSKARKGTSWGRCLEVFARILEWKPHVSGLSSGEGLKYHVRDGREENKTSKHGESITEVVDEGVIDKRLLVVEPEFASALRAASRQGSTLSATIREGWDSGNLRTLTKHDPVTATGAHISIITHVTANELRAELTATDTANGFANRFLFAAVRRSKKLPFGGDDADEGELQAFADRLRERMVLARSRHRVTMTPDARTAWAEVYSELSEGHEGLHGAVTARAEAQTVRLALIYALLDGADQIDTPHLVAALEVWRYCDATAKHVFGASLGDRIADELLRRLLQAGDAGMTRTEISHSFGRHQSAERIGAALDILRNKGLVISETMSTAGRSTETWRAAK